MKIVDVPEYNHKRSLITLGQDDTVKDFIKTVSKYNIGGVPVMHNGELAGIFTERDVLTKVLSKGRSLDTPLKEVMTTSLYKVHPHDDLMECMAHLISGKYRHLIITGDQGNLINILTQRDLTNVFWQELVRVRGGAFAEEYDIAWMARTLRLASPVSLQLTNSVQDAIDVMVDRHFGAIPILDGDKLVGIFSERDVISRVLRKNRDPKETPLKKVMTKRVKTASARDPISSVVDAMASGKYRHKPIVDYGTLNAMVSQRDVMKLAFSQLLATA